MQRTAPDILNVLMPFWWCLALVIAEAKKGT